VADLLKTNKNFYIIKKQKWIVILVDGDAVSVNLLPIVVSGDLELPNNSSAALFAVGVLSCWCVASKLSVCNFKEVFEFVSTENINCLYV
jgi:hypothetical protein